MARQIVSQRVTPDGSYLKTRYADGGVCYETTAASTAEQNAAAREWLDRFWVQPMVRLLLRGRRVA